MDRGVQIGLQVKTARKPNNFRLTRKAEDTTPGAADWFVLVRLGPIADHPEFYIVPTEIVSACIYLRHRRALDRARREGRSPKDTDMRDIAPDDVARYRNQWQLLEEPAGRAPNLLPEWAFDETSKRLGLPEGHPGLDRATKSPA